MADIGINNLPSGRKLPVQTDGNCYSLLSFRKDNIGAEDSRGSYERRLHRPLPEAGEGPGPLQGTGEIRLSLWDYHRSYRGRMFHFCRSNAGEVETLSRGCLSSHPEAV